MLGDSADWTFFSDADFPFAAGPTTGSVVNLFKSCNNHAMGMLL